MTVAGVHHVSLTVTDLDRSVDFYSRLLGFRLIGRKHRQAPDLGDALWGPAPEKAPQPAEILIADLELAGTRLELIQYLEPASPPYHGRPSQAGSAHLALLTEDIEAEVARLKEAGVLFHTPVRTVRDPGRPLWRWCYFRDPDGVVVELVQSGE